MQETYGHTSTMRKGINNACSLCILLMFWLAGCTPGRPIAGTYASARSPYSFTLRPDSTYSYRYQFEFAHQYSSGTWRSTGSNTIALNSYISDRTLPLKVQEMPAGDSEMGNFFSVSTGVTGPGKEHYRCMVFVNDTLYATVRCDTISHVSVGFPVKSIFFRVSADAGMPSIFLDTLSTEKFRPANGMGNKDKIDIVYNDSLFNYRVFNNEEVKLSKKGLTFYDKTSSIFVLRKPSVMALRMKE